MVRRKIVVFSGGSAANNLVDVFNGLLEGQGDGNCHGHKRSLSYIIGISDNGGSTSEILRVFGGPGIGDVRSRLIRLVPGGNLEEGEEDREDKDRLGTKKLLNYRLPASNAEAKLEWLAIVEGGHWLWREISSEKRELVRSFLVFLHAELLKRGRPSSTFNFHSASVGNLFLTGARIFFGSFESAIYLFRSITGVPGNTHVIPAINSNFAHHIAAGLDDGTVIIGQNQISHPSSVEAAPGPTYTNTGYNTPQGLPGQESPTQASATATLSIPTIFSPSLSSSSPPSSFIQSPFSPPLTSGPEEEIEDANLPGSLASLRTQNIVFSKDPSHESPLPSRIRRIWYINPYGQEIRPPANPKVIAALNEAEAVVYSIGSLYTSIVPTLILRGLHEPLRSRDIRFKILILNGCLDRETSWGGVGGGAGSGGEQFTAADFIEAIVTACESSASSSSASPSSSTDLPSSASHSLSAPPSPSSDHHQQRFITHLIHLDIGSTSSSSPPPSPGSPTTPTATSPIPKVDSQLIKSRYGIECVRVYGRRAKDGKGGMYYDRKALGQALQAILGRPGGGREGGWGRRFTDAGMGTGGTGGLGVGIGGGEGK